MTNQFIFIISKRLQTVENESKRKQLFINRIEKNKSWIFVLLN